MQLAGKMFGLLWFLIIVRGSGLGAVEGKIPLCAGPALSRVKLQ